MFDTNFAKFSPENIYSFFTKEQRLNLSKKGINLFSNANSFEITVDVLIMVVVLIFSVIFTRIKPKENE